MLWCFALQSSGSLEHPKSLAKTAESDFRWQWRLTLAESRDQLSLPVFSIGYWMFYLRYLCNFLFLNGCNWYFETWLNTFNWNFHSYCQNTAPIATIWYQPTMSPFDNVVVSVWIHSWHFQFVFDLVYLLLLQRLVYFVWQSILLVVAAFEFLWCFVYFTMSTTMS